MFMDELVEKLLEILFPTISTVYIHGGRLSREETIYY